MLFKEELRAREGHFIRERGTLNNVIAGRTNKQYRIDNKEKIRERKQQYRIDNKEKLREREQQYRNDNKGKIKANRRDRYWRNIERLHAKIQCPICHSLVCGAAMPRHQKSKKCLRGKPCDDGLAAYDNDNDCGDTTNVRCSCCKKIFIDRGKI